MALKTTGDKTKKTLIFDKNDYDNLAEYVEIKKKEKNKDLNSISKVVRCALKNYLDEQINPKNDLEILKRYTKRELMGYFSLKEATLIVATFNGSLYDVGTINPKPVLLLNIRDGIAFEGYDSMYNVDAETILKKLDNLSEFQAYVVIKMCEEFWNLDHDKRQGENMEIQLKNIFMIVGD